MKRMQRVMSRCNSQILRSLFAPNLLKEVWICCLGVLNPFPIILQEFEDIWVVFAVFGTFISGRGAKRRATKGWRKFVDLKCGEATGGQGGRRGKVHEWMVGEEIFERKSESSSVRCSGLLELMKIKEHNDALNHSGKDVWINQCVNN
jgi:hypothetical protein